MTTPHPYLLDAAGLDCAFRTDGEMLLEGVDLTVSSGEVVVVLGASGTGKTTLVELLFGLTHGLYWRGQISMDRNRAALVLQQGAVFDHMDVRANLEIVRTAHPGGPSGERAEELLELVNLPASLLDSSTTILSGGQRQRLCVARALAAGRSLLVFDEPTAGLDTGNIASLAVLIRELSRSAGRGALVVTHDLQFAAAAADRVLLLSGGRLVPFLQWDSAEPAVMESAIDSRHAQVIQRTREFDWTDASPATERVGGGPVRAVRNAFLGIGDTACLGLRVWQAIPAALRLGRDFFRMTGKTVWRGGITGVPFFAIIGALLGAIVIAVLFGGSPLSPRLLLSYLKANHITALTPALAGFLFAARSGSTLVSWVGVMTLGRQFDAMETLGVEPRVHVHVPVWIGTALSYLCSVAVFFCAMWLGTYWMARFYYGVADVTASLDPFGIGFLVRHTLIKGAIYVISIPTIILYFGLARKRCSADVAHDVARQAIVASLFVVAIELLLALEIEPSEVLREVFS